MSDFLRQKVAHLEELLRTRDSRIEEWKQDYETLRTENKRLVEELRKSLEWQDIIEDDQGVTNVPHNTVVHLAWWHTLMKEWRYETCKFSTGGKTMYGSNYSEHGDATHWMPLPQPPQQDKE